MPVGIDCDLNRTVAHLVFHVGEGGSVLDQQTSERVPKIMEPEASETGPL